MNKGVDIEKYSEYRMDMWECFLCCKETSFDIPVAGWLANYHPICDKCADAVITVNFRNQRSRLTYHKDVGDIRM
jgi:hypothetical protein